MFITDSITDFVACPWTFVVLNPLWTGLCPVWTHGTVMAVKFKLACCQKTYLVLPVLVCVSKNSSVLWMIQNIYSYVCQQFEYLYTVIVWRHLKDTRNIFQNESEFFNYVLGFSNITGVCLQGTRAGIKIVILGLKLIWLQLKCVFLTLKVSDESKKNLDFFFKWKRPKFQPTLMYSKGLSIVKYP